MVHELNYQSGVVAVNEAPVEILPHAVRVRAAAVSVIVAAAALLVLREAKAFVVPVLASVLCAYALEPAVAMFRRRGVPRPFAAIIIYMLLAVTAIGAAQAARTRVTRFVDTLPTRTVWPSGCARATISTPMFPAAPGRLSTTNC